VNRPMAAAAPAPPKEVQPPPPDSGVRKMVAQQVELELQRRMAAEREQAAERARLEQEERERQAALAAAEKVRLEQEDRDRQAAAEKAHLEELERQPLEAGREGAVQPADLALVSPAFKKIAAIVGGTVLLIALLYWATRPKAPEVVRHPEQELKTPASNVTSEKPPNETPVPGQGSESRIEPPKSPAEILPTRPENRKSATAGTMRASKPPATLLDPKVKQQIAAAITEGDWHKGRGEYQEAINCYQKGLALDPSNADLKRKIQEARNAKQIEDKILGKNPSGQ
jgi:tetratricopeptide (TPR) repeat protein